MKTFLATAALAIAAALRVQGADIAPVAAHWAKPVPGMGFQIPEAFRRLSRDVVKE